MDATYTEEEGVASRGEDLLIFLACSLTLDLASSMDGLALATVERARTNCVGTDALEAAGTRIVLDAEMDMLSTTAAAMATRRRREEGVKENWKRGSESISYKQRSSH